MINSTLRPVRRYAIQPELRYPLRDAAFLSDLTKDELRRAVVLGEIVAESVADDREYLIPGRALQEHLRILRPQERPVFETPADAIEIVGVFLAIPMVALLILAGLRGVQEPEAPPPDRSLISQPQEGTPRTRTPLPPRNGVRIPPDWRRDGFLGW